MRSIPLAVLITFGILIALFLLRTPVALRQPQQRPAWIATGAGILGLLTVGAVVPLEDIDTLLGGANIVSLGKTVLPTIAFWFLRDAIRLQISPPRPRGNRLVLLTLVVAQVIAFVLVPSREGTDENFVNHAVLSPAGLIWALLYTGGVLWIAATAAVEAFSIFKSVFGLFVIGAFMIAAACLALAIHCVLVLARVLPPRSDDALTTIFALFFYTGIVFAAFGFVVLVTRELAWRAHVLRLLRINRLYPSSQGGYDVPQVGGPFTGSPESAAYIVLMKIRDRQLLDSIELSAGHERIVSRIERRMSRTLVLRNFESGSGER